MKKCLFAVTIAAVILIISNTQSFSFPIGFSLSGGFGASHYSMGDLDNHLKIVRQDFGMSIPDLSSGVNIKLQGRIWMLEMFALSICYEHLWGETVPDGVSTNLTYKAPSDIYTLGGVVKLFSFPKLIDLNAGANLCIAESIFGTNLVSGRRLMEFKSRDKGFELFLEVVTSFINPVEIGFQLGYRGVTAKDLEDQYGREPGDYSPLFSNEFELSYNGAFYYLTAGIRL
jgi:hypothetical protein